MAIHYARALNGPGNNLIKKFIIQGGNFLGICAGSYYGGNYVEFAKSSNIEVTGKRELGLYNGTVRGPILCDYYYDSDRGARAAEIIINPNINQHLKDCYVFYNGGGYFVNAENISNTKILAKYNIANSYAAIIECKYGKGTAILSGVHFEYDPNIRNSTSLYHIINILKESNQKRIMLLHYLFKILSIDH